MKTFEQYNTYDNLNILENEIEQKFLELSHLDELEIRFDFINKPIYISYFYKDENFYRCLFEQSKYRKDFYITYSIWSIIDKYSDAPYGIEDILKSLVEKYFGIKNYKIWRL